MIAKYTLLSCPQPSAQCNEMCLSNEKQLICRTWALTLSRFHDQQKVNILVNSRYTDPSDDPNSQGK